MNDLIIITAYTSNISELSNLSYDSITKYCSRHSIKSSRILLENIERPASWYKIPSILSNLEHHEYVMWIDSDTTIINYDFDIQSILDNESEIYVCTDINGINCGVMIWKNTPNTRDILNKIWSMDEFINHNWWEQAAFRKLYDDNYNDIQHITKIVEQHKINSYDYALYGMTYESGQVNEQSMLIHLPGLDLQTRIRLITKYKEQYDIPN
jgi:hypothetical protein